MKKHGFDGENVFLTFEEYSSELAPDSNRFFERKSKMHANRFDLHQKSKTYEKLRNNEKSKENES